MHGGRRTAMEKSRLRIPHFCAGRVLGGFGYRFANHEPIQSSSLSALLFILHAHRGLVRPDHIIRWIELRPKRRATDPDPG